MTDREAIMLHRKELIGRIMEKNDVDLVLICNGIRENLDSWLFASEDIPVLQPFGRLNLFVVDRSGTVAPFCAYENHPCDFPHYPLFAPECLETAASKGKLGVVNPECMLQVTCEAIAETYPQLEFVNVTEDFAKAKARRCQEEVDGAVRAANLYDKAFGLMPWLLRPGQTELQIVADLRRRIGMLGAEVQMLCEDPMATTLVDLTASPDGADAERGDILYPGRPLKMQDRVNVCVRGYLKGGFAAALGRCYVLGHASEETKQYWSMAVEAQDFLALRLKPGETVRSAVEALNRELLLPAGIAPERGNCVFGIGFSRSESPRYADRSRDFLLEENMTLVIAPRIVLPAKDPYCCMDMYRVTQEGCVRLGGTSRELRELSWGVCG